MTFDPATLSSYPKEAGVYLMKNDKGKVLYVGKAKNLKVRLRQYFTPAREKRAMIPFLTSQIAVIDTIVVPTEKEAFLLENNLIKTHKPPYNVLLKDDKTYINLLITDHKWPMIQLIRYKGKPKEKGTYFGPYTSAKAARQVFDLISRLFPLRQCSDLELAHRTRPCLLFEIKRCIAPCINNCTQEEYAQHVTSATKLLKGQDHSLIKELRAQMEKAAENLEFEKAHSLFQTITQIEHVTQVQHVDNPSAKNCDVLGIKQKDDQVMIVKLHYEQGKLIASEHFSFSHIASEQEVVFISFLLQHYTLDQEIPPEILLPLSLKEKKTIEELLSEVAKKKITLLSPQKGRKKDLIDLADKNASSLFEREQNERFTQEKMLLDLKEALNLTRFPRRIECFDTSNLSGKEMGASMVVFINGVKEKSRTRLFTIRNIDTPDDYAALHQVLTRHLTRQKENKDFPDLLIIDGGKGHLNIAQKVLQELNIASIDLISIAKEKSLHTKGLTKERIFLPYQKEAISFDSRSPLLFLLQKIRDEAHRTAIHFHRKKRSKKTLSTSLDELPGIGPTKRKILLTHFKSVANLKKASPQELEKIKGLTQKDRETLLRFIEKTP